MEKMMFFGLAILFAMMTAVPPRPVEKPMKHNPADHPQAINVSASYNPNVSPDKPQKLPVKAIRVLPKE